MKAEMASAFRCNVLSFYCLAFGGFHHLHGVETNYDPVNGQSLRLSCLLF